MQYVFCKKGAQKWVDFTFQLVLSTALSTAKMCNSLQQNIGVLKGRKERNGRMVECGAYIYLICIPVEDLYKSAGFLVQLFLLIPYLHC